MPGKKKKKEIGLPATATDFLSAAECTPLPIAVTPYSFQICVKIDFSFNHISKLGF